MTVQDLGKSCIELVQDAGSLQSNPADSFARRDLTEHARNITEKVIRNIAYIIMNVIWPSSRQDALNIKMSKFSLFLKKKKKKKRTTTNKQKKSNKKNKTKQLVGTYWNCFSEATFVSMERSEEYVSAFGWLYTDPDTLEIILAINVQGFTHCLCHGNKCSCILLTTLYLHWQFQGHY